VRALAQFATDPLHCNIVIERERDRGLETSDRRRPLDRFVRVSSS